MGWRTREAYKASSKWGAFWRWTHAHLAEVTRMEWAMRRSRVKLKKEEEEEERRRAESKYTRQQEHTARLLLKIVQRGAKMLDELGDKEEWRMRWLTVLDMSEQVARGEEINVMRLGAWAAEARRMAEEDEASCRKNNREGWAAFAKASVKKGGKAAHRWLKGPANWTPEFAGSATDPEYGPQEIAEECLTLWSDIWGCKVRREEDEEGVKGVQEREEMKREAEAIEMLLKKKDWAAAELPPITVDDIRLALKGFKVGTGTGHCGWHPRVWAQLPEEGLVCLGKLLELVEEGKVWPNQMRDIDLLRIAKESGGHRLIGILPTLYRLWGKIRRPACVQWEGDHNDGSDFAVTGQSAQKAAWDFALTNEAIQATGGSTISWQGDLEKCYELVPFKAIMEEAEATGFPPVLVKLAIGMYAGRRRIVKDKAYSRKVETLKGIIAECSIATTLIKVCLYRIMLKIAAMYPTITRRIYLDDISLQWKGRGVKKMRVAGKWQAAPPKEFYQAVCHCIEMRTAVLKARASEKSRFVANSASLLKTCLAELKGRA